MFFRFAALKNGSNYFSGPKIVGTVASCESSKGLNFPCNFALGDVVLVGLVKSKRSLSIVKP